MMKLFGRKGKSIRIEIILAIVIILLVLCIGFGYCLRFTHREAIIDTTKYDPQDRIQLAYMKRKRDAASFDEAERRRLESKALVAWSNAINEQFISESCPPPPL